MPRRKRPYIDETVGESGRRTGRITGDMERDVAGTVETLHDYSRPYQSEPKYVAYRKDLSAAEKARAMKRITGRRSSRD